MPCMPPLLFTGRRFVSRLLKDLDAVLSKNPVHQHPQLARKNVRLSLPSPEALKLPEQDSAEPRLSEDSYVSPCYAYGTCSDWKQVNRRSRLSRMPRRAFLSRIVPAGLDLKRSPQWFFVHCHLDTGAGFGGARLQVVQIGTLNENKRDGEASHPPGYR